MRKLTTGPAVRAAMGLLIVALAGVLHGSPGREPLAGARVEAPGRGELSSLSVFPSPVRLRGKGAASRLVVTGVYANGGVRDLSARAELSTADPSIARMGDDGRVHPVSDGETVVRVRFEGRQAEAPVVIRDSGLELPINFANDIVPIFSKFGCNAGGCHGKSGGQNGFQLSLFGFDPRVDYRALTRGSRGRRVFPARPEHSLLLRKATGSLPHGGGALIRESSAEYRQLVRWMRASLPFGSESDPTVVGIDVHPRSRVLERGGTQQIVVLALYSDGRREDVTDLAQYSVDESEYLAVDESGLVSALDRVGQGSVLVRYRGQVGVFSAAIPSGMEVPDDAYPPPRGFVDELVFDRLKMLGIPPSALASDAEFLRRVSLDITGTLPRPAEVEAFLADGDPARREKLIDRLLESREYSSYFALFWADILRNRRENQQSAAPLTVRFHRWIRQSLDENRPYDRFVREIICAEGNIVDSPAVGWYRMLGNAKALVDDTAQVFLGTRVQCARCHHHPHEKWSQDDYWKFANFFSRVRPKNNNNERGFTITLQRRAAQLTDDEEISASYRETYRGLRPLGGEDVEDQLEEDPRQGLVDWMVDPANPLFARAVVNRYWKHFFARGIVEPEDDLRETNPPSNPRLLDALATDFVESGFDLKHLIRRICNSVTYQLSSVPNEHNKLDRQNFSRFQPRRMSAEVLLDALDSVLGTSTDFNGLRRGSRAIELPDESARNYFLDVFGKPQRTTACACERSGDVTLSQVLHLLNSDNVQRKIAAAEAPPSRFVREKGEERDDAARLRELFLGVFSRPPGAGEVERALRYLDEKTDEKGSQDSRRRAWEDIVWALLNTREFVFIR